MEGNFMAKTKILKSIVAALLICMILCTSTACATKLYGTYTTTDGLVEQSFTFKEDNKVAASAFGIDVEGTYEIKDGKIIITYSLLGLSYDWEKSFEKKGSSIFIDGTEFVKE